MDRRGIYDWFFGSRGIERLPRIETAMNGNGVADREADLKKAEKVFNERVDAAKAEVQKHFERREAALVAGEKALRESGKIVMATLRDAGSDATAEYLREQIWPDMVRLERRK